MAATLVPSRLMKQNLTDALERVNALQALLVDAVEDPGSTWAESLAETLRQDSRAFDRLADLVDRQADPYRSPIA